MTKSQTKIQDDAFEWVKQYKKDLFLKFANPYDLTPYNQDDWKAVKDDRNIYYDFNGQLVVADGHEGILKMGEYYHSGIKDLAVSDGRLYLATPDKLYCYGTE